VWSEFTATFLAGIEPIAVLDLQTAPNGNDFALDDISIKVVPNLVLWRCLPDRALLALFGWRRSRKA